MYEQAVPEPPTPCCPLGNGELLPAFVLILQLAGVSLLPMAQCWGSDFVYQPFMAECWQFLFCRFKMCGFLMSSPVSVLSYWCLKHQREDRTEQTPGTGSWSQIISFHSLMSRLNPILIGRKSLETWIK